MWLTNFLSEIQRRWWDTVPHPEREADLKLHYLPQQGRNWLPKTGWASSNAAPSILPKTGWAIAHPPVTPLLKILFLNTIAEVFYGANYRSTIITSKNTSKNLSFCCFRDKKCIKMPSLFTLLRFFDELFDVITFWRCKKLLLKTPKEHFEINWPLCGCAKHSETCMRCVRVSFLDVQYVIGLIAL